MKLFFSKDATIRDINKEFQRQYPFLLLGFYKQNYHTAQGLMEYEIPESTPLKNVSDLIPAYIRIEPTDTVEQLEKKLLNKYSLPIQVLRKAGDIWIETSRTSKLTLAQQNRMGAASIRKASLNAYTLYL